MIGFQQQTPSALDFFCKGVVNTVRGFGDCFHHLQRVAANFIKTTPLETQTSVPPEAPSKKLKDLLSQARGCLNNIAIG